MTLRKHIVRLLQTTRLNRVAHRLYYNKVHGFGPATQSTIQGLDQAFAKAAELGTLSQGDYYEFGMFKGYSFWWAQKTARQHGATTLRFFGFDSFQGLPEVQGHDITHNDEFYAGQYACSVDQVRDSLDQAGVDWKRTVLTQGYFNESLKADLRTSHAMRPVVIALIDCDLYASTVDVLRFIGPLLMDKSILIFDDWNCFQASNEQGQRKALAEFLGRHPEWVTEDLFSYGSWGQGFLLHRRATNAPG